MAGSEIQELEPSEHRASPNKECHLAGQSTKKAVRLFQGRPDREGSDCANSGESKRMTHFLDRTDDGRHMHAQSKHLSRGAQLWHVNTSQVLGRASTSASCSHDHDLGTRGIQFQVNCMTLDTPKTSCSKTTFSEQSNHSYLLLLDCPLLHPARGVEPEELALARRRLLRGAVGRGRRGRVRRGLPGPLARAAQEARARGALLRAAHRHRRHRGIRVNTC